MAASLSEIRRVKVGGLLKNELKSYDRHTRAQILYKAMNWILTQTSVDPKANDAYMWFQQAYQVSQNSSTQAFFSHYVWDSFGNVWDSPSFKRAVHSIINDDIYSEDEEEDDSEDEETEEEDSEQENH
jgi:hypothetical protein